MAILFSGLAGCVLYLVSIAGRTHSRRQDGNILSLNLLFFTCPSRQTCPYLFAAFLYKAAYTLIYHSHIKTILYSGLSLNTELLVIILKLMVLSPYLLAVSLLASAVQSSGFAQARTSVQPNDLANTPPDLSSIFITDCEANGKYGLYSYFLFPRQPVFNAHARAIKQTEQLLRKIHKLKQRYASTAPRKQHAFYIPVSFEPQSWVTQPTEDDYNAAARWVVRNFDHQCAKELLATFPRINNTGPYILSSTRKLRQKSPWRMPVLTQDFSGTKPDESQFWISTFFKKTWQPQSWGNVALLGLRDNIQAVLFNRYHQKVQNNVTAHDQNAASLSLKPVQIEPENTYPVNKHAQIEANPYFDKITIQLQKNKQAKNK